MTFDELLSRLFARYTANSSEEARRAAECRIEEDAVSELIGYISHGIKNGDLRDARSMPPSGWHARIGSCASVESLPTSWQG